jgi:hypothetical protein
LLFQFASDPKVTVKSCTNTQAILNDLITMIQDKEQTEMTFLCTVYNIKFRILKQHILLSKKIMATVMFNLPQTVMKKCIMGILIDAKCQRSTILMIFGTYTGQKFPSIITE